MLIRLKRIDRKEDESMMFNFPYEESEISNVYNQLELETSIAPNCYIEEVVYDSDMNEVLKGKECNIDELNFVFKRIDSFDAKERKVFLASTFAENPKTIAELINLCFNTHCYSLVSDFNNLETVGKDLYLSEKQAAVKELDELDGESFAMGVIKNNPNFRITPYGVLYKNSNVPEQIYNGKQFPPYHWKETMATIQLTAKGANEFIYLPCSDLEIQKALMRLEVSTLSDCEIVIIEDNFSDEVLDIITSDTTPLAKIDTLNKLAEYYKEIGNHDIEYFEKLMDYVKPRTVDEIFALADSMYEFELFDGIHSVESYGRYMICDSGHFEYDSNLEGYIDFKKYGQEKMAHEFGAFSEKGYITYHGYNQKLANLLFENLGMVFPEQEELQTLKLYMPLRITTYDIENEYGYKEYTNEPQEISNHEVVEYLDVILKAIEENNLPEEDQRGLMRYYDDHNSVNAKVSKYVFSVEIVEGELMGVAVLTLNDELTPKELEKIKDNITGQQASEYALTEILVCVECGHLYRRQVWSKYGQKSAVWRCENRLKNGTNATCKNSPTLKEEPLHNAIMTAINNVVENKGEFIGAFRENVIRVIGDYSTKDIPTEYDGKIEFLQKEMLSLIEENAKQGAVAEDFDDEYKRISEEINELKKAKLRLVQEKKQAESYGEQLNEMESTLKTVRPDVREFDEDLVRRLIKTIKVNKGERLEIQFESGIVMEQIVDYYD